MSDKEDNPSAENILSVSVKDNMSSNAKEEVPDAGASATSDTPIAHSPTTAVDFSLTKTDKGTSLVCDGNHSLLVAEPCVAGLAEETHTLDSGKSTDISTVCQADLEGDTVQVPVPVNMVFNQKDTRVMYLNSDGTIICGPPDLSSCSENIPLILDSNASSLPSTSTADVQAINSNYLVVVENIDGSHMLSTSMDGNLVLNSAGNISMAGIAPQSQISYSTSGNDGESSKLDKSLADYSQQTITMVLDGGTQLNSKGVLVDPNSFITYTDQPISTDQLALHTVESESAKAESSSNANVYEAADSSFIDISSFNVIASNPSSTTVHHKPNAQTLSFSAQGTQTVQIQKGSAQHKQTKHYTHKLSDTGAQDATIVNLDQIGQNDSKSEGGNEQEVDSDLEELRLARQKEEQRFLEQCHLAHHIQQIKERQARQIEPEDQIDNNSQEEEEELSETLADGVHLGENSEIDDDTPIFSAITAKLNSAILAHVPGCQQFLLDKAKDVTFESEANCTFKGSLKSLTDLHNLLKRSMNLRSRTLVQFKVERDRDRKYAVDKILYSSVKPYVSLRGRRPKCSLKAAEMDFLTDVDAFIGTENVQESSGIDGEKAVSRKNRKFLRGKRKRRRCSTKRKTSKMKVDYVPEVSASTPQDCIGIEEDNEQEKNGNTEIRNVEDKSSKAELLTPTNPSSEIASTVDELDPLQKRLREEQLKYKEIINKKRQHKVQENVKESGSSFAECNASVTGGNEEAQGAPADIMPTVQEIRDIMEASDTGKQKGRQLHKLYEGNDPEERVHPRNPLTESAATKQQRRYEEKVSFKFFCNYCSYKTKRQSHFLSHMMCHRDGTEKKYNCKQCDFVSISIPMLRRHELKHKKNLFWCDLCAAYSTDRKALLRRHIRMKHGIDMGKLKCDQCRFTCENPDILARHQADHENVKRLPKDGTNKCPDCKKSFRLRMHLKRHIRDVHGPELRPYLCDKCGKAFKRTDALQQHKLVHVSRTARSFPFKCTKCEKGFRSPAHLKEHMSMHSSERPFLCQYCGAAFKTPAVQKKHIMTLHIRPRTHVCGVCCRQFNTKHALQRHENTHAKPDTATEVAVSIIERENALAEKGALHEKHEGLATGDSQTANLSATDSTTILVEGQISNCLTHDMIGTAAAAAAIEEPLEQSGPGIQQAYIQGAQDGTLYYFTGELPALEH